MQFSVFLRGVTWVRDSHGLFDYESKSITKKSLKTQSFGKIVRTNNDIELVPLNRQESNMGTDPQTLLQIKGDGSKFHFLVLTASQQITTTWTTQRAAS